MVDAIKGGLVPPGNINVNDSQGEQTLMAQGMAASTLSDYSGLINSLYNVKDSSKVTDKIQYLPTPGVTGPAGNLSNPDGMGIPKQAKNPAAAAKFIEWFNSASTQEDFSGLNGQDKVWGSSFIPSRISVVEKLAQAGGLADGTHLAAMLKTASPVFPQGAPTWYPTFSNAVYTNLHAAATGSMSARTLSAPSLRSRTSKPGTADVRPRGSARPTPRAHDVGRGVVVEGDRFDGATSTPRPPRRRLDALPYVLVAPVAIFIVGLALVPAAFTIIESFFKVDALDPPTRFTGIGNFVEIFQNHTVMNSVANTAFYVVVGVGVSTVLAIAMAVLLQHPFRGRGLVIAILILPWALPGVVEGICGRAYSTRTPVSSTASSPRSTSVPETLCCSVRTSY